MSSQAAHVEPIGIYLTVFGMLIVLTMLTFAVSYAELPGNWSLVAAMTVATIKAMLVGAWFMHLKHDTRFNLMVFLSAFWFMAVFFGFTMTDLTTRGALFEIRDNHALQAEKGEKYATPAVLNEGAHGAEPGAGEGGH
ncbi:MAG: cytochrome oxidase subunit IV [Oligoflexia bacterium]|nr:cytochrome oxidase subunit IV [Oligoflexia bacterium]